MTVAAAQTALTTPLATNIPSPELRSQPKPKISAGKNVKMEATPSRDNQELRHCDSARHARVQAPELGQPCPDRAKRQQHRNDGES